MLKTINWDTEHQLFGLPALPPKVLTKERLELPTCGDMWSLQANADGGGLVSINFIPLVVLVEPRFLHICKLYVAYKARTSKTWSLANIVSALCRAVRFWRENTHASHLSWDDITVPACQALLTHGLQTPIKGCDFAHVRALYEWGCHVAELDDFDPHVALALKGIKAPGNNKGERVSTMNPTKGPLTPEELELVNAAIRDGRGEPEQVVVAQIFSELGIRPIQLLRTRWGGLRKFEAHVTDPTHGPRKLVRYTLSVPRAKSRSESRQEIVKPISTLLGSRMEALRPHGCADDTPLASWFPAHTAVLDIAEGLQEWACDCRLKSPRTKKQLRLTPYRFRYSMAIEAARDGASRLQIAALLDHSDTQHVEVYINAAGTIMDLIEGKLDKAFGPMINRFLGKVVAEDEMAAAAAEGRVIPGVFPQLPDAPMLHLGIGACGHNVPAHGPCQLAPPIACYTCPKFAAFRNGPHSKILASLEQMAKTRFGGKSDARIAGELAKVIAAIRALVRQLGETTDGR